MSPLHYSVPTTALKGHPRIPLAGVNLGRLEKCDFTAACCGELSSALSTSPTLAELDLQENKPEDSGVKLLCEGLTQPACNLQKRVLGCCRLTSACCEDLASALKTNQSLKELDLSGNKLGETGIKLLLLFSLSISVSRRLECCLLTADCCNDLASVLGTNQTLTELDLRNNELRDSGVKHLCAGLKRENCKIQKLV
uniref:NLR family pyrin domain containing 12 n=1 Tax=Chrysemys picta bellii TaxID=8478 RepID=A0A8C3FX63_CHRPI